MTATPTRRCMDCKMETHHREATYQERQDFYKWNCTHPLLGKFGNGPQSLMKCLACGGLFEWPIESSDHGG